MLSVLEVISLLLVGATWGCSNSFLQKGSTESAAATKGVSTVTTDRNDIAQTKSWIDFLTEQLYKFRHISVWLPYVINQFGSILFYITLSQTDLSIAVPTCNALALIFSIATSYFILKEPIERPIPTIIGALFVIVGVAICVHASQ